MRVTSLIRNSSNSYRDLPLSGGCLGPQLATPFETLLGRCGHGELAPLATLRFRDDILSEHLAASRGSVPEAAVVR